MRVHFFSLSTLFPISGALGKVIAAIDVISKILGMLEPNEILKRLVIVRYRHRIMELVLRTMQLIKNIWLRLKVLN
jgi:hypothetical protein